MDVDFNELKEKLNNIKRLRGLQEADKKKKPVGRPTTARKPRTKPDAKKTKTTKDAKTTTKTKKPKKEKKEKKEKSTNLDSDENTTDRKWNDFKNIDNLKKGQFTDEESDIVLKAICDYAYENNLKDSDLLDLVTEKQTKDRSIWPKISECLPNRSVQSIHNFCHRVLSPYNYKGAWTSEEEKKLIE
jgi:hypothetical protein